MMRIGVDVGGTFTDIVTTTPEGQVVSVKTPSTPDSPARGVLAGLSLLADEIGRPSGDLMAGLEMLIHGTTVATNILVEGKGAKVALLTTEGFSDLLVLRDGTKQDRYRLRAPFPEPLVPADLRIGIRERVLANGTVEQPLDMAGVDQAIDRLLAADVQAVAICFLHSYLHPQHEQAVASRLRERMQGAYISCSSDVLRRAGEYDRLSTTVADCYAGPGLAGYLGALGRNLADLGSTAPVSIMQSNGGVLPVEEAARLAVGAVTSGPAGGAVAAALYARHYGLAELVSYDTGGTSSDVCLVLDGTPVESGAKVLANTRIAIPAIEIDPVALGGGSIASVDRAGMLRVGPQSAGASPGPAAFGKGGTEPTLTDANLVLGLIGGDEFLGGKMRLDAAAARAVINDRLAAPLGLAPEAAAAAVHALSTDLIAEGVRRVTVRRGLDPRGFTLLPFGGAGGLHADEVARSLGIRRVVIPAQASVLSALGFLAAELRRDLSEPLGQTLDKISDAALQNRFAALEKRAREALALSGVAGQDMGFRFDLVCRYRRQVSTLSVPVPGDMLAAPGLCAALQQDFTSRYRKLYQHSHDESAWVEELRVAALGRLPEIRLAALPETVSEAAPRGVRMIHLSGAPVEARIYDLDGLTPGAGFDGPAIAVSRQTTVLVLPGTHAHMDGAGSLILNVPEV
ncbi:hydantoinase/oxoprolinase family protein [Pseudogemmobacter sonorensis]|uniref:hydantoinase/oxoprolinase family protein n=1 Tax=Pseudogemmobacter sonorensis TaxID=2989681 RepID=UPI0036CA3939